VNKDMKEEELEEIKKILSKEFGCLGTIKPIQ
jgi:translation initiation factor 1 (eIF-1/SUI1)